MSSILFGVQLLLLPLTNRAELKTRSRKTKASSPSLWETNNPPLWTPPLLRQTPRQWDPKQCRRNLPWEPGKLFSLYVSWPWCFWFHTWWLVSNLSFFLSLPGATGERKNTSKRVRTMTASMVFTVLCSLTHTCSLVSLFSGCVSLHRFSKEVSKLHQKGKGWFHESIRESSIQESHLSASLHWTKRAWCVFCFFCKSLDRSSMGLLTKSLYPTTVEVLYIELNDPAKHFEELIRFFFTFHDPTTQVRRIGNNLLQSIFGYPN